MKDLSSSSVMRPSPLLSAEGARSEATTPSHRHDDSSLPRIWNISRVDFRFAGPLVKNSLPQKRSSATHAAQRANANQPRGSSA